MAETTEISWCDHTANLWWGCTEVHAGCDHCYARTLAKSKGKGPGWEGMRYATVGVWKELLKWNAAAQAAGKVSRVFCGSMMDIFEKTMPVCDWRGNLLPGVDTQNLRDRYFNEIVPATPHLMHLLLTKRPSNILRMVPPAWLEPGGWPRNVMTGTSPVDQPTADTLIPQLLRVPGSHFLSMEPLLGPVNLRKWIGTEDCAAIQWLDEPQAKDASIDWVIVGGESGPHARPMHPDSARSLRNQCEAAGVPFHFKQWGEWGPTWTEAHKHLGMFVSDPAGKRAIAGSRVVVRRFPNGDVLEELWPIQRHGKKTAGHLLDGVAHQAFPKVWA